MPVTKDQVEAFLASEEPDYDKAATSLGAEALPHLESLVSSEDTLLASKAAYLAGRIGGSQSLRVLKTALSRDRPEIRIGAAAGAKHLDPDQAEIILITAISDPDVGVRKIALRSVASTLATGLKQKVENIASGDSDPFIRALAGETARELP